MTFSVSKTFLSSVAGVAFDKGMIKNVNDRVIDYVQPTPDFMLPHNQPITWDNMLRQDSGWIGTMWGKPWWADRPGKDAWSELAKGPPPVGTGMEIQRRARQRPGAGADLSVEAAAARGAQAICRRSHRHVGHMALGRL